MQQALAKCRRPLIHYIQFPTYAAKSAFGRPQSGAASAERDRAHLPQLPPVEAENQQVLLNHTLDYNGQIILAPGCALTPMSNLCLSDFREIGTIDGVNLEQAIVVVSGVVLRSVRTIHHSYRHMFAIVRHRHAFRCLPDTDRIDDTRRFRLEVNHVDDVNITLPTTLIADDGNVAFCTDLKAVRPDAPDHKHLAVFDLVAIHRQDRNLVVTIAGYQGHLSIGRECDMGWTRLGVAKLDFSSRCELVARNREYRHGTFAAV